MFHWVNLLLQPAETAARESEWSAHDWKEVEHSGASVGFEWTRGEETGGQVHEVKTPVEIGIFQRQWRGNTFWPGLTPFGSLLWQAEADTEMTLPASPTTAVCQKVLFHGNLFYHQIFIRLYHYALGLLWWWWSYSYCATPHGSSPTQWNSTTTSGRWRKWRCVL